jgi:hypothetical protein
MNGAQALIRNRLGTPRDGLIATAAIGPLVAAQFGSALDHKLAGHPLTSRGQVAIAEAKELTLGRPSVAGLAPHEATPIRAASGQSSLGALRVGIGVAGSLVIIGGLVGAAGIRNPRCALRPLLAAPGLELGDPAAGAPEQRGHLGTRPGSARTPAAGLGGGSLSQECAIRGG